MITQADLHELTDRVAKQFSNLVDTLGLNNTEQVASASDICDSLNLINVEIIDDSGEKELIAKLDPVISNIEKNLDAELIAKYSFGSLISGLENYLRDGGATMGFDNFASDNSGTRYASYFLRLAKLRGFGLLTPIWAFYDGTDTLGTFVLASGTTGAWTPSAFAWASTVLDMYGVQPSTSLEIEAKTSVAGGSDIDVLVTATEPITEGTFQLTGSLPAGSAAGTAVTLTSTSQYANYAYKVNTVSVTKGTAADEFYINFKPIRTIALD